MVSTKGTVCSGLRVWSGRSLRSPRSIQSWTWATRRRAPVRATSWSRKSMTSGKLWPVSIWSSSKGTAAGANARRASSYTTTESLPPENRRATLSHWPATSRRIWIDSSSRAFKWGDRCVWVFTEALIEGSFSRFRCGGHIRSWRSPPTCRPGDPPPAQREACRLHTQSTGSPGT